MALLAIRKTINEGAYMNKSFVTQKFKAMKQTIHNQSWQTAMWHGGLFMV
jgi:hypothetical protein